MAVSMSSGRSQKNLEDQLFEIASASAFWCSKRGQKHRLSLPWSLPSSSWLPWLPCPLAVSKRFVTWFPILFVPSPFPFLLKPFVAPVSCDVKVMKQLVSTFDSSSVDIFVFLIWMVTMMTVQDFYYFHAIERTLWGRWSMLRSFPNSVLKGGHKIWT